MKELKKLNTRTVTMAGNFVTVTPDIAKMLSGAADIDSQDDTHIIPRNDLLNSDFQDIWWVGDYSDVNTGDEAGFVAIHLMNALNTTGFKIQSTDKNKGQLAFNFQGHYSMDAQDTVPYEVYVKEGSGSAAPHIYLNKHSVTLATGASTTLTVDKLPANASVTWSSANSSVASVSDGVAGSFCRQAGQCVGSKDGVRGEDDAEEDENTTETYTRVGEGTGLEGEWKAPFGFTMTLRGGKVTISGFGDIEYT